MKMYQKLVAVASLVAVSAPSFAAGADLSSLTSAVDFGTVTTAILAIGALIAGLFLVIRGVKTVLPMIKGR